MDFHYDVRACHWSLTWAKWIWLTFSYYQQKGKFANLQKCHFSGKAKSTIVKYKINIELFFDNKSIFCFFWRIALLQIYLWDSDILRPISILCSHLKLGSQVSSDFLTQILYTSLSHICYMSCPSHPPRFDHPNNIWQRLQIMKLIFSSLSLLLLPPSQV
jgi:hypothetical protein